MALKSSLVMKSVVKSVIQYKENGSLLTAEQKDHSSRFKPDQKNIFISVVSKPGLTLVKAKNNQNFLRNPNVKSLRNQNQLKKRRKKM